MPTPLQQQVRGRCHTDFAVCVLAGLGSTYITTFTSSSCCPVGAFTLNGPCMPAQAWNPPVEVCQLCRLAPVELAEVHQLQ